MLYQGAYGNMDEIGSAACPQGIYEESSKKLAPIGTRRQLGDRVFYYAKAGSSALSPGKLCVVATAVANDTNRAVYAAAAVGQRYIKVTLGGATTADYYADGYVVVNDATGEGQVYKILSHPAGTTGVKFTLYDALEKALTTSSEVTFVKNPYDGVVISVTDQGDHAIGVPLINVTANYYFWLQTWGIASVLADETIAIGAQCTIGTGVAGAVETKDAISEPVVGIAYIAAVDTEYRPVFLTLSR